MLPMMMALGAGAAVGGGLLAGSGKRPQAGVASPYLTNEQLPGTVWQAIQRKNAMASGPLAPFQFGQDERSRAMGLFETRQRPIRQEILDSINAEAAKAGLSGTTFAADRSAKALHDLGGQRLGEEVRLDELGRALGIQELGFRSGLDQELIGAASVYQGQPFMRERSQTMGQMVGPALAGLGGQLAGMGAYGYGQQQGWFGGAPTAKTSMSKALGGQTSPTGSDYSMYGQTSPTGMGMPPRSFATGMTGYSQPFTPSLNYSDMYSSGNWMPSRRYPS